MTNLVLGVDTDRSPCVLVHGAMRTGRWEWWPIATRLALHRRVVVVDLPGHGADRSPLPVDFDAMCDQLVQLVRHLGGPVHLIGHSNGGSLVLAALPALSERVASAVIQGANACVSSDLVDTVADFGVEQARTGAQDTVKRYQRIHSDWESLFQATQAWTIGGPHLSTVDLEGIETPCLVIEGAQDELNVRLGHGDEIARHLPVAYLWQPTAGHDVHVELASEWLSEVERFLALHERDQPAEPTFTVGATDSLKAEPASSSEQLSQVLPGELLTMSRLQDGSARVRHVQDGYAGWIRAASLTRCDAYPMGETSCVVVPFTGVARQDGTDSYPVGTEFEPVEPDRWRLRGGCTVLLPSSSLAPSAGRTVSEALDVVLRFVGVPYEWGGRTERGIDCSGLVQLFWRLLGVRLPRDSWEQYEATPPLDDPPLPGDIGFFADPDTGPTAKVTHVALNLGENRIVHAFGPAGEVVVDDLTELQARDRPPRFISWGQPTRSDG